MATSSLQSSLVSTRAAAGRVCFGFPLVIVRVTSLHKLETRLQIVRMHHHPRNRARSELTEYHSVRNLAADWDIEPEAHFLANIAFHHSALDLIAKFVQQLLDALLAKVRWIGHGLPVCDVKAKLPLAQTSNSGSLRKPALYP